MKNIYTDITSENTPTASDPILFETYMLNTMLILLVNSAVIVKTVPFIKNFSVLFKLSPFNFIIFIKNILHGNITIIAILCKM